MKIKEPAWATHKIEWRDMVCFYNDERFHGFWKDGRDMWRGGWGFPGHKDAWLDERERDCPIVITDLLGIQENE